LSGTAQILEYPIAHFKAIRERTDPFDLSTVIDTNSVESGSWRITDSKAPSLRIPSIYRWKRSK